MDPLFWSSLQVPGWLWVLGFVLALGLGAKIAGMWGANPLGSERFRLYIIFLDRSRCAIPPEFVPGQQFVTCLTYVPARVAARRGLKGHQIVGFLHDRSGGLVSGNLTTNRAFKEIIWELAQTKIPPAITEMAATTEEEKLPLYDERSAGTEHVEQEDCLGWYRVEAGLVAEFFPNREFRFFADEVGPLQLTNDLRDALYAEIEAGANPAPKNY